MGQGLGQRLKGLMEKIPGYRGYAEKEARREADKELRDAVAAAFSSQVTRVTRVQEQLINNGDFDTANQLDRVIGRMQHLADRIRTASYGYTGFFDEDVVSTTTLDRLYAFDLEMANGVEQVGDLIAQVGLRENREENLQALQAKLDQLHDTFSQRGHFINTFSEQGSGQTSDQSSAQSSAQASDQASDQGGTSTSGSPPRMSEIPIEEPLDPFVQKPMTGDDDGVLDLNKK